MKLQLTVSPGRRFVPLTDEDRAKARTLPVDAVLTVHVRVPRNPGHHKKFRKLVGFVADHHPIWRTAAGVMYELKLRTGHFAEHIRETGEVIFVPLPTNFDEMDEGDFVVWATKAKRVIAEDMLPGFRDDDIQRLDRELDDWTEWCLQ